MAGALLSISVPVSRWLHGSQEMSLVHVLTRVLIATHPALSPSLCLLSSSPVLCPLFQGSWFEALLGAQLNETLQLHPLHPFFLWIIFQAHQRPRSAPCKAPLVTVSMFPDRNLLELAPGEESEGKMGPYVPHTSIRVCCRGTVVGGLGPVIPWLDTEQGQDHLNVCRI